MAWSEGQTLQARWEDAKQTVGALHKHWKLGTSYGGFTEALTRSPHALIEPIKKRLRTKMLQLPEKYRLCCRRNAFAVDGSRLESPHMEANELGLGCAGREKTAPQVFLTTIRHMGTGLAWDFHVGPGTDSERTHLRIMLPNLPENALLVADAGFAGYELCQEIIASGRSFLFRVGGNITLLEGLGFHHEERDGLVYLWPQGRRDEAPLVLRLIKLTRGKQTIYLLTNVLDAEDLTEEEASILYEMRWGIEVFYRSYKQTMDRRKLLSRTPATCLAEAQWIMLGVWLLGLMTVQALIGQGHDPLRISFAKARDAVRRAMRRASAPPHRRSVARRARTFQQELRDAVRDEYRRTSSKEARNYPRKKRQKPPGPPKIKTATEEQRQHAQRLRTNVTTLRRTA